jgi:hypothetical protein
MMMRYFKAYWDESRGDKFDSWGCSWWYFETDDAGNVQRQLEKYENGVVLRYDHSHVEDEHGGLAEKPVFIEAIGVGGSNITKSEFEQEWNANGGLNQPK